MILSNFLKKGVYWGGFGAGLAGVAFIAIRLWEYSEQLDFERFGVGAWAAVFSMALIYGCANFFLANAWWHILGSLSIKVSRIWALKTYGISQLAKYVPGNVVHVASRQAMGISADHPGWIIAKSILWELCFLSAAGLLLSSMALPFLWPVVSVWLYLLILILMISALTVCIKHLLGIFKAKAFAGQLVFLLISGMIFAFTIGIVIDSSQISFYAVILYVSSYVCAWFLGFITPGAPAGIGIRETVLLVLLSTEIAKTDLLVAMVLNRFITTSGDGVFFAWAALTGRKH